MSDTHRQIRNVCAWRKISPDEAMDAFQERGGLISDNCASLEDVSENDAQRALEWLQSPKGIDATKKGREIAPTAPTR